jgi:hypothetical protein
MIDSCFNSKCHKPLMYLREGRVIRVVHGNSDKLRIEHYWLCGDCYEKYDFHFQEDDSVSLGPRFHEFIHLESAAQREIRLKSDLKDIPPEVFARVN